MDEAAIEAAKRQAGERAAALVEDGHVVGLGTGSTAAAAVKKLGRRVDAGLDVRGIPTSAQSGMTAREAGIPVTSLEDATPNVAIDGADQVAGCTLLKGGGAAHAREKVVAAAADRVLVVVDETKLADALSIPVPLEVLDAAVRPVIDAVDGLGGTATRRAAERKDGPVVTDNGHPVVDAEFGTVREPVSLARELDAVPGIIAHGLFVDLADTIIVGRPDETTQKRC